MEPQAYCFHKNFEPAAPAEYVVDRHYLLCSLEGTLRLEADGQRWTLPPARAALINAGHPITITILSRLTSASVLFAPSFMRSPEASLAVFDMTPLARELVRECRAWGPGNGLLSPYAHQVFSTLSEVVLRLACTPSPCVLPVATSQGLKRAVAMTEDLAGGAPSFNEIARETGHSPRALARKFSDELGMTWREVLRRVRIIRAVEALATSEASVTEVALSVGYQSLSGFNAAFRDLTSMNPTEYRASFKQ